MPKKAISKKYFYAVGRRKSSIATVKLFSQKGESTVNNLPSDKYFSYLTDFATINQPFKAISIQDGYYYQAKIVGGGVKSQIEALTLAISRCLLKSDETLRKSLRQAGLLTVDPRVKQRRMVGTGGKSRRQKQSPKR